MEGRRRQTAEDRLPIGDTAWRRGSVLKRGTTGELVDFDERSFYQLNDDVTLAVYRVQGYGYPVLVWFDNMTGKRIGSECVTATCSLELKQRHEDGRKRVDPSCGSVSVTTQR